MPRRSKGARLYLQPAQRSAAGLVIQAAIWVIRDGRHKRSTGYGPQDCADASDERLQDALSDYIIAQRKPGREKERHPSQIPVADVIAVYLEDKAPKAARPDEVAMRAEKLLDWWTGTLADVNGKACRDYAAHRGNHSARRELEDLRAAINHHRREGLCSEVVEVVLPERATSRERWLTRKEAAKLIWALYRYRDIQKGIPTNRRSRRHVARFVLVALYTGTRSSTICRTAFEPGDGRPWIDLENGVYYRRPVGKRETKKRNPPIKLPPRLLAHLRRWKAKGICKRYLIEFLGKGIKAIEKAFRNGATDAKLGDDVIPHTLRHTTASWGMQNGADHGALADYLGMTVEMLRRVYGHHDPSYLADARDSVTARPGQFPDRMNATKREQTSSTVVKLNGKR